jgi:hypothetical protein
MFANSQMLGLDQGFPQLQASLARIKQLTMEAQRSGSREQAKLLEEVHFALEGMLIVIKKQTQAIQAQETLLRELVRTR